MLQYQLLTSFTLIILLTACNAPDPSASADITVAKWQKISLDFPGPETNELADLNPFTDYRLDVTFINGDHKLTIPGYYAADGEAGETGAEAGNIWRVNFRPDMEGFWEWKTDFHRGENVATTGETGQPVNHENASGSIWVIAPVPGETGRLERNHPRYLQWSETGEYFLKGGADSPENFLAYKDFDGTYRHRKDFREGENKTEGLHHFTAHEGDWKTGDLTWMAGKGKGMVGALNYLAGKGINSFYFLTMNINGDGKDVWPFVKHDDFTRFDCSKLDQWEMVFDHADDNLGMMLHIVLQETENETLFDGGDTGPQRSLYLRELIARFGHHRAVTWNIGEENGPNDWSKANGFQTNAQQAAMANFFEKNDPYNNYVTVHTHPTERERKEIIDPLLGNADFDGLSLQVHIPEECHEQTQYWIEASAAAGVPWIATIDEVGPWFRGLDPDDGAPYNNQDSVRALVLWGNLMAGGAGVEWYFGARNAHNDLGMEDWRSRDRAWGWTSHAIDFFREYLPFDAMEPYDKLVGEGAYCFAKPGEVYLVYLLFQGLTELDLSAASGDWTLRWLNPRTGELTDAGTVTGGASVQLEAPGEGDFAALLTK
jgi:hypothetical protein